MSESEQPRRIETFLYDAEGNRTEDESVAVRGEVTEARSELTLGADAMSGAPNRVARARTSQGAECRTYLARRALPRQPKPSPSRRAWSCASLRGETGI